MRHYSRQRIHERQDDRAKVVTALTIMRNGNGGTVRRKEEGGGGMKKAVFLIKTMRKGR